MATRIVRAATGLAALACIAVAVLSLQSSSTLELDEIGIRKNVEGNSNGFSSDALISHVANEWSAFGFPIRVLTPEGAELPTPDDMRRVWKVLVPTKVFTKIHTKLQLYENAEHAQERVSRYWSVVDADTTRSAERVPWSAAFVSWAMVEAGASERDFSVAGSHNHYVSQAERASAYTVFIRQQFLFDTARPGDLVCRFRYPVKAVNIRAAANSALSTSPMHCDVVVETVPESGLLMMIGGNVDDAVSLSVLTSDVAAIIQDQLVLLKSQRAAPKSLTHWIIYEKRR